MLLAAAGAAAVAILPLLEPERLRAEAEARLADALDSPVSIGRVELALGIGIHLQAEDLRLWPGPEGEALHVSRVAIGVEPLSLLTGTLRPRRMVLQDARLDLERDAAGVWLGPLDKANDPPDRQGELTRTERVLKPLIGLQRGLEILMKKPWLADSLRVRDAVVKLRMAARPTGSPPLTLILFIEDGSLSHSLLRGDARLEITGRLRDEARDLGPVQLSARRDRHGGIEARIELTSVDTKTLENELQIWDERALLAGRFGGSISIDTQRRGHTRLDAALAFVDLEAKLHEDLEGQGDLRVPLTRLGVALDVTQETVEVERMRVTAGDLVAEVSGKVERPLATASAAELRVLLEQVPLGELRRLLEWLPVRQRDPLEGTVTAVESGRLLRFETRGAASLGTWQDFFSGSRAPLAMGLEGGLEVSDVVAWVGDSDRIEKLGFRGDWTADRLDVVDAHAELNGSPLPTMSVSLDGISNLLEAAPERQQIRAGALPLPGVDLVQRIFAADEDTPDDELLSTVVSVDVDVLEHPIFIWPLRALHAVVETERGGARISLNRGSWAGVPISGEASWRFEPASELRFALAAGPPEELAPESEPFAGWARGTFIMGPVRTERWRQAGATGTFRAWGGTLRVEGVEVALDPGGLLRGSASLDLASADAVPYQVSASLIGGDVSALGRQIGLEAGLATGFVSAWTTLEGTLREDVPALADLDGFLEMRATDGQIWRKIPAIVAVALASKSFTNFSSRDTLRYDEIETLLEFKKGRMKTDSFSLDGPDLRVFAEGKVDLANPPHEIKAEVALFLFRQLDRALDKIPILNLIMLGTRKNLLAAHFELTGPWNDPKSKLVPLKSFNTGPANLVFEGLPNIVGKGLRAIGKVFKGEDEEQDGKEALVPAPAASPFES